MLSNYFKTNTENAAPCAKKGRQNNKDLIDTDLSLFGSVAGACWMLAGQEKASSEAKARKLANGCGLLREACLQSSGWLLVYANLTSE